MVNKILITGLGTFDQNLRAFWVHTWIDRDEGKAGDAANPNSRRTRWGRLRLKVSVG
jgi:hypothetical protein